VSDFIQIIKLAIVSTILGLSIPNSLAETISEGFQPFPSNKLFTMQAKSSIEDHWSKVCILAKWAGNRQELLAQLSSAEWVAGALQKRRVRVTGTTHLDKVTYLASFPIVGQLEFLVKQTTELTNKGFIITFQCKENTTAKFKGQISVEVLPRQEYGSIQRAIWHVSDSKGITERQETPAEQYLLRLSVQCLPPLPFASIFAKAYESCVYNNLDALLTCHTNSYHDTQYFKAANIYH